MARTELLPTEVARTNVNDSPVYAGKRGLVLQPGDDGLTLALLPGDGSLLAVHLDADELDLLAGRLAEILTDATALAHPIPPVPGLRLVGGRDA